MVLRSESPSGKCAKLHTVAASNNRDHALRSLYYCLFAPHTYGCCSLSTSRLWWITHSMSTERLQLWQFHQLAFMNRCHMILNNSFLSMEEDKCLHVTLPVVAFLQMLTKSVTMRATTATRARCVWHGMGHNMPFSGRGNRNAAKDDPWPNILQLNTEGLTANKYFVTQQLAYKNKTFLQEIHYNVLQEIHCTTADKQVVQACCRKVDTVTTSALHHNATKTLGSCPQRSSEALELLQGWLEVLLPSHKLICWDIASSGHIKYWEGIPGYLRELTICGQTMYPMWPSEELCAMLGQRVWDPLSLLHSTNGIFFIAEHFKKYCMCWRKIWYISELP